MHKVIEKNITEKKIFLRKIITSNFSEMFWLIDYQGVVLKTLVSK